MARQISKKHMRISLQANGDRGEGVERRSGNRVLRKDKLVSQLTESANTLEGEVMFGSQPIFIRSPNARRSGWKPRYWWHPLQWIKAAVS